MKKNIKVIYLLELVLLLVNLIFYLMIKVIPSEWNTYLVITFLLLMIIPLRLYFGKYGNKSYYSGYATRSVIMVLMAMGIIIYLLGLLLGFTHGYRYSINTFLYSFLPLIIMVLLFEYLRFIVVKNNHDNIKSTVIFTILLAGLEVFSYLNLGTIDESYDKFVFICLMVIPILADQFLCTYLTYKTSMVPSVVFRLITKSYLYILPIIPNLGDYIFSFVKTLTPFMIFYIINRALVEEDRSKRIITKNSLKVLSIPVIIILVVLVLLVSGIFNNRLIAIASNSMSPLYRKGDSVIYEKIKPKDLQKGDILVFSKNNMIITHRIVNIKKKGEVYYFTTKGDANDKVDGYISTSENVVGRVTFVIKYIGYPTIFINELFGRS